MFKYIKNISIIVIALFLFVFAFMKMISIGIDADRKNNYISNDDGIKKLQQVRIEQAREMVSDLNNEFTIPTPKQASKISTYHYTKPNKSIVSLQDKACNDAIFKAMSDKSEEAQKAKKELCSHNLK